jgi:hypothetical protein
MWILVVKIVSRKAAEHQSVDKYKNGKDHSSVEKAGGNLVKIAPLLSRFLPAQE